ncbi:MAG: winged helix-turn-helix transcriptional regulator [bacterium]
METPEKTVTPQKTPQKTREKTQEKTREKTAAAILRMLGEQPEMSIAELAERLGKVPSTIERAIRKLRESGRLKRIGPDKGGHWQLIE